MVASATSLVFDDLKKGFNKNEVLARVVHFWEARSINKGGLLMGFELFLIDQKGTTIHAFIPANRIACYEEDLKAGVIYKIKKFLVIDNKTSYKVTSHKFLIQFTQQTVLAPTDHAGHDIERQNFRIRSYAEFNEAVNKNEDLYDALGKPVLINDENFNNGVTNKRIDIHMQLKDGPIVRVTLWGNVADNFQKKLMESVDKPMVLLATTMNPKTFRDVFCLSSTSSTRIFFDNDIEPTTNYLTWLRENGKDSEVTTSEVTKPETVTLSELHQFLQNDTPPTGTFCCFATIVDILPQYGWYRVELTVCDKENVATFVIFDKDTAKLAGRKAAEILEDAQDGENGVIDIHNSIPGCLEEIVGRTYKFELKFTPFNFTTPTRQTFTVTQILEEENNEVDNETDPLDDVEGCKEDHDEDDSEALDIQHKDKRLRHE
ncbi:hypothetical protein HID58_067238 [Brassica napus]|uniref:Replication protein A 70 kDa DNA-binding subunit B/D first OB fold domain-containing protein n=1 Tax=Brassica napus TaxID=3708 RepID=A0ABQ7ZHY2_BRANA|nr:uncharacterized protein LOC106392566 [Brassica napus]KAH0879844.1 hypothetical protein HID58_067238 [Brassica napus]